MARLDHHVLIVGAGAAGTAAASELRRLGFGGRLTLLNGEEVAPYNRTTVNTTLLRPDADLATVGQRVPDDGATSLLSGARARSVDLAGRTLRLEDGTRLGFDTLLIACGARPRSLPADVEEGARRSVTTLRTAADAERIREALGAARLAGRPARVVVAGAGLLGSETADALSGMGHTVHLVDPLDRPLERILGRSVASWVEEQQRSRLAGVWRDATLTVRRSGQDELTVGLRGGHTIAADLVVAALGVVPEVAWLAGTGLDTVGGVLTDDRLRVVGAPGVYAAGDVARAAGRPKGEHWGQALGQGVHAARVIASDLGLAEEPGPLAGTSSFATRLHDHPITVLGTLTDGRPLIVLVDDPGGGVHVSGAESTGRLVGAVVRGPSKVANKLRPLVEASAPLGEATAILHQLGLPQMRAS